MKTEHFKTKLSLTGYEICKHAISYAKIYCTVSYTKTVCYKSKLNSLCDVSYETGQLLYRVLLYWLLYSVFICCILCYLKDPCYSSTVVCIHLMLYAVCCSLHLLQRLYTCIHTCNVYFKSAISLSITWVLDIIKYLELELYGSGSLSRTQSISLRGKV